MAFQYLDEEPSKFQYLDETPTGYSKYVADYKKRQAAPQIPRSPSDTQFPTMEPMLSEEEWTKKDNIDFAKSVADRVLGVPDAAASFVSKLPAQMAIGPSYLYGRLRGKSPQEAEDMAAMVSQGPEWTNPKTQTGERILQATGNALQAFGPEPYTRVGAIRVPRRTPKNVPVETPVKASPTNIAESIKQQEVGPRVQAGPLENAGERAFNDMALQQMEGYSEPIPKQPWAGVVEDLGNERARLTQKALDERQTVLEFEVKKQGTADFNAAERARQEVAPIPELPEGQLTAPQQILGSQRGAINPQVIKDITAAYKRGEKTAKDVLGAFRGTFTENEYGKLYTALNDPKGKDTVVLLSPDQFHALAKGRTPSEINEWGPRLYPEIKEGLQSKEGLWDMPFLRVQKDGQVIAHEGRHRMDVFKETGLDLVPVRLRAEGFNWGEQKPTLLFGEDSKGVMSPEVKRAFSVPMPEILSRTQDQPKYTLDFRGQRGASNMFKDLEEFAQKLFTIPKSTEYKSVPKTTLPDSLTNPISPETIAKKTELAAKAKAAGYTAYDRINTIEEAKAGMVPEKDMSRVGANTLRSGSEAVLRTNKDNTIVNWVRTNRQKAFNMAEEKSKQWVTGENGIVPIFNSLVKNIDEANAVAEAIVMGDKKQFTYTPEHFKQMGWSENQIKAYQTVRAALDDLYAFQAEQGMKQGYEPFKPREGYSPSNFGGDYMSLVGYIDEKGNWKLTGIASANTKFGLNKAIEKYKSMGDKYSNTVNLDLKGLKTSAGDFKKYNGFAELVSRIAEHDPEFAKARLLAEKHVDDSVRTLYNFDVHEIKKSGIKGALGDRPWLTREQNTKDLLRSITDHLETGFKYAAYQDFMMNAEKLAMDPEVRSTMPNTAKWLGEKYLPNIRGNNLNKIGALVNSGINKLTTSVGLGPTVSKKTMEAIQTGSTAQMMGMGNIGFGALQMTQLVTGGMPEAIRIGEALNINPLYISDAIARVGVYANFIPFEEMHKHIPKEVMDGYTWAKKHGISDFSEAVLAHQVGKSQLAVNTNKVINAPIIYPEKATRLPMFLIYDELFRKAGYKGEEAHLRAQAATNYAMADYTPDERPAIYNALGEAGKPLGALTTFKHNLVEQMVSTTVNAKEAPAAALMMATIAAGFYGISGLPGYHEANELFKKITDKSFREVFMSNPDKKNLMMDGALSYYSEIDFQARMSMSQISPDPTNPLSAVPHIQNVLGQMSAAIEYAKNQDEQSLRNLIQRSAGAQGRYLYEAYGRTDEHGNVYDVKGALKTETPRTQAETNIRGALGLRPLRERLSEETTFTRTQRETKRKNDLKEASQRFESAVMLNNFKDASKWNEKYIELGGDPKYLYSQENMARILQKRVTPPRDRISGKPGNSIGSIKHYQAIQDGE